MGIVTAILIVSASLIPVAHAQTTSGVSNSSSTVVIGSDKQTGGPTPSDAKTMSDIQAAIAAQKAQAAADAAARAKAAADAANAAKAKAAAGT